MKTLGILSLAVVAGLAVVGQQSTAQDNIQRSLVDALDQDFDAFVANIDADTLRQFSQSDAIYLLNQAKELWPLGSNYFADVVARYNFEGSTEDLLFFSQVAESVSDDFVFGYCERIAEALPSQNIPQDCIAPMAAVFVRQYGTGLPVDVYTPEIMDILFRLTQNDAMIVEGSFSDLSSQRALRHAELTSEINVAALANGMLCAPLSRSVPELSDLYNVCRNKPITPELVEQADEFSILGPIVTICSDAASSRGCLMNLSSLHHEFNTCDQPLFFPEDLDWYGSTFFKTCLAAYALE